MPPKSAEQLVRDGLKSLQLGGSIFLRAEFTQPWAYASPSTAELEHVLEPNGRRIILFHIFTEGHCVISPDTCEPIEFRGGDIAILPFADPHRVGSPDRKVTTPTPIDQLLPPQPWTSLPVVQHGGGGDRTSMVCGYLLSDDLPLNPVLSSLPRLIHVRPSEGPLKRWVEASVQYALHASERAVDGDPLLERLPELLFMECLCEHIRQHPETSGWLAALADPIVGRALGCLHARPEHAWTLDELAQESAASRSTIDDRFRDLLGCAPITYLTAHRLQLAGRKLRASNASIIEIAESVGYGSEASFSRAFKRHTGKSPSDWRSAGAR